MVDLKIGIEGYYSPVPLSLHNSWSRITRPNERSANADRASIRSITIYPPTYSGRWRGYQTYKSYIDAALQCSIGLPSNTPDLTRVKMHGICANAAICSWPFFQWLADESNPNRIHTTCSQKCKSASNCIQSRNGRIHCCCRLRKGWSVVDQSVPDTTKCIQRSHAMFCLGSGKVFINYGRGIHTRWPICCATTSYGTHRQNCNARLEKAVAVTSPEF